MLRAASTEQGVASSNGAVPSGKLLDFDELTDIIRSDQGGSCDPQRCLRC